MKLPSMKMEHKTRKGTQFKSLLRERNKSGVLRPVWRAIGEESTEQAI